MDVFDLTSSSMSCMGNLSRSLLTLAGGPLLLATIANAAGPASFRITSLSNRPDKLSGGNAPIRVDVPDTAPSSEIVVKLNEQDVSSSFHAGSLERGFVGLVTGLRIGSNKLEVFRAGEMDPSAELELTNHPIRGPVFSGPQEQPFLCQTEQFKLPDGKFLGPPLDFSCSVNTVVHYVYRARETDSGETAIKLLTDMTSLPRDVDSTTTSLGDKVPFIVRIETGTINRSIYQIAVLHNPISEPIPTPFTPSTAWNRRLLYSFGGGCVGGWYKQGSSLGVGSNASGTGIVNDGIVGKGYASVSASLNVFGNNCQDVTAAETMMMVKEHFIETFGSPLFTFGRGGSGGAYQQIQIADNYPGLLDGIIPGATFPDVLATIQFLTDIQLLNRYYRSAGDSLSEEQKRAIAGVGNFRTIAQTAPGADRIKARGVCPPDLPPSMRYDPVTNRTGARCDVFDHTINVYGRDPDTRFARRPIDNTGVQYGLAALNAGVISVEQFLDINEHIGGYDNDGSYVASRSLADPQAVRAAYETGRVTNGGGGLASVPIIDSRNYLDMRAAGDLHLKYHSFGLRERLQRANGETSNEVLLVAAERPHAMFEAYTIAKMDEWLTNLTDDKSSDNIRDKIARAKPVDLVDACFSTTGERIIETQTFSGGECNKLYPTYPSPRMVAGGPVTNDVLKCQLKPADFHDYTVEFTESDKARLTSIFPGGVCDWSKPGIEQRKLTGVWLAY